MVWRTCKLPYLSRNSRYLSTPAELYEPFRRPSLARHLHAGPRVVKHNRLLGDADHIGHPYQPSQLAGDVKVSGLIRSIRKQKHAVFAHISDGTTLAPMQVVLTPELAQTLTNGAYVEVLGTWQESAGRGQSHELQASAVDHVGPSNPKDNPVQKKNQTSDYLRGIPHLRLRIPFNSLLARFRNQMIQSLGSTFGEQRDGSVIQVHPPLISSSDCEGAGEVFTVAPLLKKVVPSASTAPSVTEESYFGQPKYLTVSSQLHLEAYSAELGDVWALSPTFRAEESDTARHLSEFYMLEAEYRDLTQLNHLTDRVEELVKAVVIELRGHRVGREIVECYKDDKYRPSDEPVDIEQRWTVLADQRWVHCTYTDAMKELRDAYNATGGRKFKFEPEWGQGLQLEHEKWIVENLGQNAPVFVTDYPKSIKPFYMLPSTGQSGYETNATVACFDLLFPFGCCEVAGGSLREHRLDQLMGNMRRKGMLEQSSSASQEPDYPFLQPGEDLGSLRWYADLRRYGSSPHGGFGLGFDRLLAYLTGLNNVRDVVVFPRTWRRAEC